MVMTLPKIYLHERLPRWRTWTQQMAFQHDRTLMNFRGRLSSHLLFVMYLSKISRRDRSERSSFEYTCKMSCHNEACLESYLCKMSLNIFFMCTSPEHHGDIFCFLGDEYTLQSKSTCHKLSVRCMPSSFRAKTFPSSDSKKKLAGGGHYEDDSSGKFIMTSFMKSRWKHNLFQTLYCDNLSEEPYPDSCYQPFGKVDFFRRLKGYFRCSRPVRPSIPMTHEHNNTGNVFRTF